jgi:major vault protein
VSAIEKYEDGKTSQQHKAGDRWLVPGPCEYIPAVECEVVERREIIPLGQNEGVYVLIYI